MTQTPPNDVAGLVEIAARAMVRGSRPGVDPDKPQPAPRGISGVVPLWKLYEHMAQEAVTDIIAALSSAPVAEQLDPATIETCAKLAEDAASSEFGPTTRGAVSTEIATAIRALSHASLADEGMVLVPREPTEAMIEAGHAADAVLLTPQAAYTRIWTAMLEAAPEEPSDG